MTLELQWDVAELDADLVIEDGQISTGTGLEAAVLISLFTEERAGATEAHPGAAADRRGWWGDKYLDRPLGSKLWLLYREKLTPALLPRIEAACAQALAWLKEVGLAAHITVTASIYDHKTAAVKVSIPKPNAPGETWERVWRVYFGME